MDGRVDVLARAERGDDDRRLPLHGQRQVLLQPGVGLVHDLVDGEGGGGPLGMRAVVRGERLGDLVQPFVELRDRPRVQRRKRADDARLALRDHQRGMRDDEQRRADDRQPQRLARRPAGSCVSLPEGHSFTVKPMRRGPGKRAAHVRRGQPIADEAPLPCAGEQLRADRQKRRAPPRSSPYGGLTKRRPVRAAAPAVRARRSRPDVEFQPQDVGRAERGDRVEEMRVGLALADRPPGRIDAASAICGAPWRAPPRRAAARPAPRRAGRSARGRAAPSAADRR